MTQENFIAIQQRHELYKTIKNNISTKKVIRIGILVCSDVSFQYHSLIAELQQDSRFQINIFVVPMITKSLEKINEMLTTTLTNLRKKYQNVYSVFNFEKQCYMDISPHMDIALFCNIYDAGVHELYRITFLSKFALCAYVPYGYTGLLIYDIKEIISSVEYDTLWKIYVENNKTKRITKDNKYMPYDNVVSVGYTKMDLLPTAKTTGGGGNTKIIIISPHHTITDWEALRLSNFLEFSDFFLELPKLYPQIHFIFRPHPLLFDTIKQNPNLWNDNVESYLEKISKIPNITYDTASDYLETFMDSSALIHDCGSFLTEYLYTQKPMLFIAKKAMQNDTFTKHGKDLLDRLYLAYTQDDIISFIDNVVINNNDYKQKKRINFANKQIIHNHGCAGKAIADDIRREIFGEESGCYKEKI